MSWKKLLWFFLGSACYIVSQPLLRLPLLRYIQNTTDFILAYALNPLLIGILIAFSAGVFEEGFRFLFKLFLVKPGNCAFSQPVIFGLGHGIAEALTILLPALSLAPVSQLGLASLERFLAIILHVNLTVVVWNGFQKKTKNIIFTGSHFDSRCCRFINTRIIDAPEFNNIYIWSSGGH